MARYLRYQDLKPLKGIPFSRQHIRRLQKALKFPLSVSFGDNTEVFIERRDRPVGGRSNCRARCQSGGAGSTTRRLA